MLNNIIKIFRGYLDATVLSKEDLFFINEHQFKAQKDVDNEKKILIQCPEDYFYIVLYSMVIKKEKASNVYGYLTIPINFNLIDYLLILPFLIKGVLYFFRKRKSKKLYKAIGVNYFISPPELSFKINLRLLLKSLKLFLRIKTKEDLLKLKINNIPVGDLIYDTCVRYNMKLPTLNLRSYSYFKFLYKTIKYYNFNISVFKTIKIDKAFFSQAVYIYHGLPCRMLVFDDVKVFSSGNYNQMFKSISKDHLYMEPRFLEYKEVFDKYYSKEERARGFNKFSKRFKGRDDNGIVNFYEMNPYIDRNKLKINKGLDGVLFLHDFYDSQKLMGKVVFNDFYEWAVYTLDLINENDLRIGIKPHPHNLTAESAKAVESLKKKYPNLNWIDPRVSNNTLFDSGIKFGISHHGTVISELAFNKIIPICCAENPNSSFEFTYEAKSINEYKDLILKSNSLVFKNHEQVGEFYYMHYINNKSDYILKNINGIHINKINRFETKSSDLIKIKALLE